MIGKQILNYKLDSLLGKGGMGTVYLGKHLQMKRKVAVKMLHPDLSSNEDLRERFRNEAAALAHLQNPYIVTLYDYYESEEGLFLIMEYIEGIELADHINKVSGPIDEKSAIHYFTQILDGFKYAHKKKVVHRDIKPSNILIDKDNDIKIMDFGIAKIVDSEKSLTKTGTQIGTVFYMSPEQVKGENIDRRSDIYSLGVTLFQMITGQCPYSNDTNEFQIYNNIVNDPLPDPASIYPGVSKHLAQVIAKATQKNVEDRFQSCEEFKKALNDTAFKTVIKEPATTEAPKTQIKEPTPTSATPPKKKKKTAIIIAVIIALVFGGGYFYLKVNNLNFDLFSNETSVSANGIVDTKESIRYELDEVTYLHDNDIEPGTPENPISTISNNELVNGVVYGEYSNGLLEFESGLKNGLFDGLQQSWYENGQLEYEENYKNGLENGTGKGWYENGQLQYEKNYKNGLEHGTGKGWYENGQLQYEENYNMGEYHGEWGYAEVEYQYESDKLLNSGTSKLYLDMLLETLIDNPTMVIEIENHTDCRGSNLYNRALSKRRAQSCVDYLFSKGISAERMSAKGFGGDKPRSAGLECETIAAMLTYEEQEEAHQINRRTVYRIK